MNVKFDNYLQERLKDSELKKKAYEEAQQELKAELENNSHGEK